MRPLLLMVAAVAAVLAVIAFYPGGAPRRAGGVGPAALAGAPAISVRVMRTDGKPDELTDHRGNVVVLNLWATWCPPCREEMPALERIWREYGPRGVVVLGVDQGESASVAAAYARGRGVTFPILVDEAQAYGRAYAALGLPTTIVIGRDGRIVRGIDGALNFEQMRAAVEPALAR